MPCMKAYLCCFSLIRSGMRHLESCSRIFTHSLSAGSLSWQQKDSQTGSSGCLVPAGGNSALWLFYQIPSPIKQLLSWELGLFVQILLGSNLFLNSTLHIYSLPGRFTSILMLKKYAEIQPCYCCWCTRVSLYLQDLKCQDRWGHLCVCHDDRSGCFHSYRK